MQYDADGNLTGWTQAEPEWDDNQRDRMLALAVYESKVCDCGFHESITHDPTNLLTIEDDVCPVCKAVAVRARVQSDQDEKARKKHGDKVPASAPDPADGRRTFVRPLTPLEADLINAAPTPKGT